MAESKNNEPKFLTVEEFAKRIGVHPQTVRLWDKTGVLLPHHKTPSGRRLYSEEQVKEYFESN
jgi:excisionase family DNA binding protein